MEKLPPKLSLLVGLTLLVLAGCTHRDKDTPLTLEDLRLARHAMPLSEVSLQLRIGTAQSAILADVQRRHIPGPLDAATEDKLLEYGAGPELIAVLKEKQNILTPKQKDAFDEEEADRTLKAQRAAVDRENEAADREAEQAEDRQRRQELMAQTARNIQQSQASLVAYENAQRNYEAQRKSLELRIQSLQTRINWLRSHGYNEAELHVANETLDSLNKELLHLTPPLR